MGPVPGLSSECTAMLAFGSTEESQWVSVLEDDSSSFGRVGFEVSGGRQELEVQVWTDRLGDAACKWSLRSFHFDGTQAMRLLQSRQLSLSRVLFIWFSFLLFSITMAALTFQSLLLRR